MPTTSITRRRPRRWDVADPVLAELGNLAVAGGAVYDALVGMCAKEHGLALATRDRRALDTYRTLGVQVELLD